MASRQFADGEIRARFSFGTLRLGIFPTHGTLNGAVFHVHTRMCAVNLWGLKTRSVATWRRVVRIILFNALWCARTLFIQRTAVWRAWVCVRRLANDGYSQRVIYISGWLSIILSSAPNSDRQVLSPPPLLRALINSSGSERCYNLLLLFFFAAELFII